MLALLNILLNIILQPPNHNNAYYTTQYTYPSADIFDSMEIAEFKKNNWYLLHNIYTMYIDIATKADPANLFHCFVIIQLFRNYMLRIIL